MYVSVVGIYSSGGELSQIVKRQTERTLLGLAQKPSVYFGSFPHQAGKILDGYVMQKCTSI